MQPDPSRDYAGRKALVTGGGAGLGEATAKAFFSVPGPRSGP